MLELTPTQIVAELDKYIVGQHDAKKSVAIALRNRYRRSQVNEPLRSEITPKNILMIGPTGVGKTEIARRLAKLANAPFIKVEATKFTEVGYVGKDVDSIIRDLVEIAIKTNRNNARSKNKIKALLLAEERVLDILLPVARTVDENNTDSPSNNDNPTREKFRQMLKAGKFDEREIEIDVVTQNAPTILMGPPGLEELTNQIQSMFAANPENNKRKRKLKIADALKTLADEESSKLVDETEIRNLSLKSVEQHGIVFIDEIDKVAIGANNTGNDVSRSGVQRDLLPLVEGTTVSTKYGMIKTDHILFIASGAFHVAKPSDLLPELQGRLPIRVELASLTIQDFASILTTTDTCLTLQYKELLSTEGVKIEFKPDGINKIAEIAFNVNATTENIGARRLYTIMEKLLEDISFKPEDYKKSPVRITAKYVDNKLGKIAKSEDLSRYVL